MLEKSEDHHTSDEERFVKLTKVSEECGTFCELKFAKTRRTFMGRFESKSGLVFYSKA